MVWQKGFKKKYKIVDRWEHVTYKVVEKLDNVPVYKIRPCTNWSDLNPQQQKICIVHHNVLFPISWHLNDSKEDSDDRSIFPVNPFIEGPVSHMRQVKSIIHNIQDIMLKTSNMVLG